MDYWKEQDKNTHYSLKTIRLKSVNEIQTLALPHNRPNGTNLITINRTDNQSHIEHIVWESTNPDTYHLERK